MIEQRTIARLLVRHASGNRGVFFCGDLLALLVHRNYRYSMAKAARALRCQRRLTGGRAAGKCKVFIRKSSRIFVGTAAVWCALRILGRAENASVPLRPAMCGYLSLCTAAGLLLLCVKTVGLWCGKACGKLCIDDGFTVARGFTTPQSIKRTIMTVHPLLWRSLTVDFRCKKSYYPSVSAAPIQLPCLGAPRRNLA